MTCDVAQCHNKAWAVGLCNKHYSRQYRTGDTNGTRDGRSGEPDFGGHKGKGLGIIACRICGGKLRDHEMRPCPEAGVSTFLFGEGIQDASRKRRAYRRRR